MCKSTKNQGQLAPHSMEQARNDHLITTDEKMQHDIYRKKIGFEVLRKVDRGTRHNWHTRLRKMFPSDMEETESTGANAVNGAEKNTEVKEL